MENTSKSRIKGIKVHEKNKKCIGLVVGNKLRLE